MDLIKETATKLKIIDIYAKSCSERHIYKMNELVFGIYMVHSKIINEACGL
jgi:hypothetical protein